MSPAHKQRIIRVLQGKGHVVGFLGDGINDAPGLPRRRRGHLGRYGGRHRQRVADVILLEKSLTVLGEA